MSGVWRDGEADARTGATEAKQGEAGKDRDARKPRGKLTLRYGAGR